MAILLPALWQMTPSPIQGYVGMNGSGKTALAVYHALQLSKGKTLISNININPPKENNTNFVRLTSLSQLASIDQRKNDDGSIYYDDDGLPVMDLNVIKNAHILIDEAQFVFNGRDTLSVPREIQGLLASLRHHQLTFAWTTPTLSQIDVQIRRVTQTVFSSKAIFTKNIQGEYWPRTTYSTVVQYDLRSAVVEEIDEFTPRMKDGFLRLKSLPLDAYDTFEDVALITDHFECSHCGLPYRRKFASHEVHDHPKHKA